MTNSPGGDERRLVLRLLDHWRSVCSADGIPSLGAVEAIATSELWPHCFVLELGDIGCAPTFQRVGDAFESLSDCPLVGAPLSNIPRNALAEHATFFFDEVLRKQAPVTRGGVYADVNGVTTLFRSILLPLSANGRRIGAILGAANCREVSLSEGPMLHGGDFEHLTESVST